MAADSKPVLVLYNTPADKSPDGVPAAFQESDAGILEELRAVCASLDRLGLPHQPIGLRSLADLPGALYRYPGSIAVNLVEGFAHNPSDMTLVPAVCRAFGVEVTGSDTPCISLALDKWRTNSVLEAGGIRCPRAVLIPVGRTALPPRLPAGPCIVKPVALDASEGIDSSSVTDSSSPVLLDLIRQVHERSKQPALVEEMIGQRELNVSLLQTGNTVEVLPLAEIDFSAFGPGCPRIVGYTAKWLSDSFEYKHTPRIIPAPLTPEQAEKVKRVSLAAWEAVGCRDYARVDIRLDDHDEPVVLEVNPNPDICPEDGFAAALSAAGYSYDHFVRILLDNARGRLPAASGATLLERCGGSDHETRSFRIRYVARNDRDAVLSLLTQPRFFRPDELDVAREVLDDSLRDGPAGHYQSFVLEQGGTVAGWACFGPIPCTLNTYDIYWIAISPDRQRQGLGKALMDFVEARIRERGGRIAVVETSGRDDYIPTRSFYLKAGYTETARIPDFYAPGDDKIVSVKTL